MSLYVVEHADGSGAISIPLPLDEAREFAAECNLPYKIELSVSRTVALFEQVNKACEQSGESVVPLASDPDIVEFYMQQMDNLDIFSPEEMAEFESFLKSQPLAPSESFGENV